MVRNGSNVLHPAGMEAPSNETVYDGRVGHEVPAPDLEGNHFHAFRLYGSVKELETLKLNMSIAELVEFINGAANVEEIKERIAGAFVAISNDPVVEDALRRRLRQMAEQEAKVVFDTAVHGGWDGRTLQGWAFEMVKTAIAGELKGVPLHEVIKQAVQAELLQIRTDRANMVKDIQDIVESILHRELPKFLTKEYAERVAERYDADTLSKTVASEVKAYLDKAFYNATRT